MYRWIKAGLLDQPIESIQARYRPRPTKPAKLERFKPLIQARLAQYPYLSGVRILKEIRAVPGVEPRAEAPSEVGNTRATG
jgi:hypothetical protein